MGLSIKAVIFDLDGVIVSTDQYHYKAWKQMADKEKIYFDEEINEKLRGVSRIESLQIILTRSQRVYTELEKIELADRKNKYYRELLNNLTSEEILPGVKSVLGELKRNNIKVAIGSSSKNTLLILNKIGFGNYFNAVADGNEIKKSKPDPEVFLLAAKKLAIDPKDCLVVEDANAGVEAAIRGGMKVLGVGAASKNSRADFKADNLTYINFKEIFNL